MDTFKQYGLISYPLEFKCPHLSENQISEGGIHANRFKDIVESFTL
jgi:hypothetical protein